MRGLEATRRVATTDGRTIVPVLGLSIILNSADSAKKNTYQYWPYAKDGGGPDFHRVG